MIGRTEDERELLRVEDGSDVGGDDRLRVDERDDDAEETIDDSRECEEDGGGVASLESEERARLAQRWVCAKGDFLLAAGWDASTLADITAWDCFLSWRSSSGLGAVRAA
jgi:hypothetical protein